MLPFCGCISRLREPSKVRCKCADLLTRYIPDSRADRILRNCLLRVHSPTMFALIFCSATQYPRMALGLCARMVPTKPTQCGRLRQPLARSMETLVAKSILKISSSSWAHRL